MPPPVNLNFWRKRQFPGAMDKGEGPVDTFNALCDALCVEPACIDAVGGTDADEALSAAGYVCMQCKESTFMIIIICQDGEREERARE